MPLYTAVARATAQHFLAQQQAAQAQAQQLEQIVLQVQVEHVAYDVQQNQQQQGELGGNVGEGHQQPQQEVVGNELGQQQQQQQQVRPGSSTRILAVHEGKGRVAERDFQEPEWLDGLLCVYEDGHLGFLWKEPGMHVGSSLVEYLRVEEEVITGKQREQQQQQRRGEGREGSVRVSRAGSGTAGRPENG